MITKKFRMLVVCLAVALLFSTSAGAAPLTSNSTTLPMASSTGAFGTNEVIEGYSPLTGLPFEGEYRPVLVQLSNTHGARRLWNLCEADIVYETDLFGATHTRYTAVYHDSHPTQVCAVRSARLHHVELRQEWDCPIVYWGAQTIEGTNVYTYLGEMGVDPQFSYNGNPVGKWTNSVARALLARESGLGGPDNVSANLQEMVATAWPTNEDGTPYEPKVHAFRFSDTPTRGTDTAVEIDIKYSEHYHASYTYNEEDRVYERWYCGKEQYDGLQTDVRIVASNVIVQFCDTSYFNGDASRPVVNTIGGGVMDAFIDGRHIRGTWERNTVNDRTVFLDMNGEEITLLPGKTFIQMVPSSFPGSDQALSYTHADGTVENVDIGYEVPEAQIDVADESELETMGDAEG